MASPRGTATWSFGGPLTPGVKYLLLSTIGVFVLQQLYPPITTWFRLDPSRVLGSFYVWQLVTYLFLHGGLFHWHPRRPPAGIRKSSGSAAGHPGRR